MTTPLPLILLLSFSSGLPKKSDPIKAATPKTKRLCETRTLTVDGGAREAEKRERDLEEE